MIFYLTMLAALLCALMAGIYFAFSVVVMPALRRLGDEQGVRVMQQVNRDILQSLFMPLFWMSSLVCLILLVGGQSEMTMFAGAIYLAGMLGVTALFNVPLNNQLEQARENEIHEVWPHYLSRWQWFNHIRTVSAALSALLFVTAA
ncbi:DUF1772 domain-containing protein [Alteromonas oceani]|uniref:DUF1772 domain-containing protein n=1 Tax=Alteromonas oceani TaxID=2071609 RepID=A0ABV7JTD9_9ALTE|nr:anthrone oxygenase family protein [Alteromonas oceani]